MQLEIPRSKKCPTTPIVERACHWLPILFLDKADLYDLMHYVLCC